MDPDKIKKISEQTVEWMRKVLEKAPKSVPPYYPLVIRAWDMGYNSVLWSAPALVVASAPEEATTGLVDVALALSYFELAAPKLGLGTCWAGLMEFALQESASVKESVGLTDRHPYHYPMMVGYPKPKYIRLPERKAPKITWR